MGLFGVGKKAKRLHSQIIMQVIQAEWTKKKETKEE